MENQPQSMVPPTHPALAEKMAGDMQNLHSRNAQLEQEVTGMKGAYQQDMEDAHNAGQQVGADAIVSQIDQSGSQTGQQQPTMEDMVISAINEGASLEDLSKSGLVEAVDQEQDEMGATPEYKDNFWSEVQNISDMGSIGQYQESASKTENPFGI